MKNARLSVSLHEPQFEKTYLLTSAPKEGSNQPAHLQSDQSLRCPHKETSVAIQNVHGEDSDQTARMQRLI